MDILLSTIPSLLLFLLFTKRIVSCSSPSASSRA